MPSYTHVPKVYCSFLIHGHEAKWHKPAVPEATCIIERLHPDTLLLYASPQSCKILIFQDMSKSLCSHLSGSYLWQVLSRFSSLRYFTWKRWETMRWAGLQFRRGWPWGSCSLSRSGLMSVSALLLMVYHGDVPPWIPLKYAWQYHLELIGKVNEKGKDGGKWHEVPCRDSQSYLHISL